MDHGFWFWSGRGALNPVALGSGVKLLPQQIFAKHPQDHRERRKHNKEKERRHNWIGNPTDQKAKFGPNPVERRENRRGCQGHNQKQAANHQRPHPHGEPMPQGPTADNPKDYSKDDAKRTV